MSRDVSAMKMVITLLLFEAVVLAAGCNGVFYQPTREVYPPSSLFHIAFQDLYFDSTDQTRLNGWFLPGRPPVKGTILFLHGNGANIGNHIGAVYWLPDNGYNVFLFDYRGYGNSGGQSTRAGVRMDALAALNFIRNHPSVNPDKLIIYGQSLGGAIAVDTVASFRQSGIKLLLIESTFSSYRKIAREKLSSFFMTWPLQWPLSFLVSDEMSPIDVISSISPRPLLVIHGNEDSIVGVHHAEELYRTAREPKDLWIIDGGGHINAFSASRPANRERLVKVLDRAVSDRPLSEARFLGP